MPTILTYGDSNTHGTPPTPEAGLYLRLGAEDRWPCVMQRVLGSDWTLIEEGLPGRTTVFNDPVTGPTMNGLLGLPMALRSHGPIDWLTIMLGTNDCQIHYGTTAEQITGGLAALLAFALSPRCRPATAAFGFSSSPRRQLSKPARGSPSFFTAQPSPKQCSRFSVNLLLRAARSSWMPAITSPSALSTASILMPQHTTRSAKRSPRRSQPPARFFFWPQILSGVNARRRGAEGAESPLPSQVERGKNRRVVARLLPAPRFA